jgi:hypothetical protein
MLAVTEPARHTPIPGARTLRPPQRQEPACPIDHDRTRPRLGVHEDRVPTPPTHRRRRSR